jgi:hypothetical protein
VLRRARDGDDGGPATASRRGADDGTDETNRLREGLIGLMAGSSWN